MRAMILVTGATGTIGSELVRRLAARGEKVRALVRDPAKARAMSLPAGVEVARGDYGEPASLEAAMTGVTAAFLVGVPGPGTDPGGGARSDEDLVAAAVAAGVGRLVKLSAIATGDPAVGPSGTWHLPGERAVRDSGAEWAVLRPSAFASNTLSWAEPVRSGLAVPNMTGDGAQGVIDPRDVAEVAALTLLDGGLAGRTYTLTGPETISAPGQAAVLADVLGRPVTTRDLTPEGTRELLLAWGLGEAQAEGMLAGTAFARAGGNAVVTEDVPELLGRAARTYREWAVAHRGAFEAG
ncbi:NAD(P)H-binding protein [Streptomyces sp. ID05-39B]|uniref:NAD(P)H-binding protein n=1 Tax=Streptomyces sp. ID05-39B TaxID=3028664 RepID=UPI0029ABDF75|nr:NAD(P)H-binding protein [Streptomyces sp. ID05-39B]MDX3529155.1 NAD(P)H-binding protein [Streptomyces sp. ID05-39B]